MGHDNHGAFLLRQLADGIEHLPYQLRIKGRGRFIKQDHVRTHGQRASNGDPLLLTAGEAARIAVLFAAEAYLRQQIARPRHRLLLVFAFYDDRPFNNVLQHRPVGKQVKVLEDKTHVLAQPPNKPFLRPEAATGVDRHIADADSAALRLLQQINAAQQGSLPRAAGTNDRHHFAFLHLQVDTVEHRLAMEFFHQAFYFNRTHFGSRSWRFSWFSK